MSESFGEVQATNERTAKSPAQPKLRIHFLVPADAGPIVTEAAGTPVKVSQGGKFRCACDSSRITFDDFNRATTEPWGVRCQACVDTEIFQMLKRPKPGQAPPDTTEEVRNGCCG